MDEHSELIRLRNFIHDKVRPEITSLEWRTKRVEESLEEWIPKVQRLIEDDKIDKAVEAAVKKHNKVQLTNFQRFCGAVIFVITVTDFFMHYHH